MAIVPRSNGLTVAPRGVNAGFNAQADPAAMGAAVAQGLDNVGSVQQDIYMRAKAAADQIAVQEAEVKAAHLTNELLYAPQTGALNRRGKSAMGIPDEIMPKFQKGFGDIAGQLKNDSQRRAFAGVTAQRQQHIDGVISQHIAGEIRAWDDETTQGVIADGHNLAVANYGDPLRVLAGIGKQKQAIDQHAERNGVPPEERDDAIRKAESTTLAGVIGRMVDAGDMAQANATYAHWKANIDGDHQSVIEHGLREGGIANDGRKLADGIVTTAGMDELGALDALEAKGVKDTEVYDNAKMRIIKHYNDRDRAVDARQGKLLDTATTALYEKGIMGVPPSVIAGITDAKHRGAWDTILARYMKGGEPTTDYTLYDSIMKQAADPNTQKAFFERNLALDVNLAKSDRTRIIDMRAQMMKDDQKVRYVESREHIINSVLTKAGIIKPGMTKTQKQVSAQQVANFRIELQGMEEAEAKGGRITPRITENMANLLLGQTSWQQERSDWSPARWFGSDTYTEEGRTFESPQYVGKAYTVEDIPNDHLKEIQESLRSAGAPFTSDDVLEFYNEGRLLREKQRAQEAADAAKAKVRPAYDQAAADKAMDRARAGLGAY